MTRKQIKDGAELWNPYEGLKAAVNLLFLLKGWLEEGHFKIEGLGDKPTTFVQNLAVGIRSALPKVKAAIEEREKVRSGKKDSPSRTIFGRGEIQSLKNARPVLDTLLEIHSRGGFKLEDTAIDYGDVEFHFTAETYISFAQRSLLITLALSETGFFGQDQQ